MGKKVFNRSISRWSDFILSSITPPPFAMLLNAPCAQKPRRGVVPQKRVLSKRTSRRFGMAAKFDWLQNPLMLPSRGGGFDVFPARRQHSGGGVLNDSIHIFR